MITKHSLNYEQSEEVYSKCKLEIEVGACYNNVFSVIMSYKDKLNLKQWKIAYGYYAVFGDMMARHCFIVNEQGEAIDPTIFTHTHNGPHNDEEYQSFYLIDNLHDYIKLLSNEYNHNPNLLISLRENEQEMFRWATENDRILIGQ